jgi:hypothetical protein
MEKINRFICGSLLGVAVSLGLGVVLFYGGENPGSSVISIWLTASVAIVVVCGLFAQNFGVKFIEILTYSVVRLLNLLH